MSQEQKDKIKNSMISKNKGANNPAWKGGRSRKYAISLRNQMKQLCSKCGSNENLEIHHLDKNPQNNNLNK